MPHPDYAFRDISEYVRFGTASDRYATWRGQIYTSQWDDAVKMRTKKFGKNTFREETVPVASTEEYFEHFGIVELDFTFYNPLIKEDGEPSGSFFTVLQYAKHAPANARFLLKAPQLYSARKFYRGKWVGNDNYLNVQGMNERFVEPALELLDERLTGVLFQQEYTRKADAPSPDENIAELDAFFADVIQNTQFHLEIRSPHLHGDGYHDWLRSRGLGYVLSHSTWQKPLHTQWKQAGKAPSAANGETVVRLLTPLTKKYNEAYALTHPFDKAVPEIADSAGGQAMVQDSVALIQDAIDSHKTINMIANNRAWGNAPDLTKEIVERLRERDVIATPN
ncbi:MAG: DUF72 domain-containing protein [Bacteroidetes bacterium]|nr:DUF72 domain-containing protein [Bacteroidota bacterium]